MNEENKGEENKNEEENPENLPDSPQDMEEKSPDKVFPETLAPPVEDDEYLKPSSMDAESQEEPPPPPQEETDEEIIFPQKPPSKTPYRPAFSMTKFIGLFLALAGAWLLGGGKLYTGFAARAASHMGDPNQVGVKGYFLFGLSYGTASLSCTLPIFLAVLGVSVAGTSFLTSVGQFLLFALGMGLVIMVLTLGMAVFKGAMVGALRKALPYIQPVGSWLMVVAGAYIVFYWLTIGGLLL